MATRCGWRWSAAAARASATSSISTTRPQDGDEIIEYDGVQVRVDPTSAQYLRGIEIDYVNSLLGRRLQVLNPNAKHTCGCGSSFSA